MVHSISLDRRTNAENIFYLICFLTILNIIFYNFNLIFFKKMADFPQDILIKLFTTCDPKTRAKCKLVCKQWNTFLNSYNNWPMAKNFMVSLETSRKMRHRTMKHENNRYPFEDSVPTDDLYTIVINKKIVQLETIVTILRLVNPKALKIDGT